MTSRFATKYSYRQITGLFRTRKRFVDPLPIGSTVADAHIDSSLTTNTDVSPPKNTLSVSLNGKLLRNPTVSEMAVNEFLKIRGACWQVNVMPGCVRPVVRGYQLCERRAAGLSVSVNEAGGRLI